MRCPLFVLPITATLLCFAITAQPLSLDSASKDVGAGSIYIAHVTVIDTGAGKETQDQTVVIFGNRISEVNASKDVKPQGAAKVVDGTGKYLIPGLWDMHVHRTEYESTYPMYLVNGVTGVREMAGPFDATKFRSDLAAKKLDIPHLFLASPIVDGNPPRVPDQIVVKDAKEARKVVQEQKRAGSDFIKVIDRLSRDAYFAILEEAKRQNIPVVGHVPFAISAWEASNSGQKGLNMSTLFP